MKRLYRLAWHLLLKSSAAVQVETVVNFLVDEWIKSDGAEDSPPNGSGG